MTDIGTASNEAAQEPIEPRMIYTNKTLAALHEQFPGSENQGMPDLALDDLGADQPK